MTTTVCVGSAARPQSEFFPWSAAPRRSRRPSHTPGPGWTWRRAAAARPLAGRIGRLWQIVGAAHHHQTCGVRPQAHLDHVIEIRIVVRRPGAQDLHRHQHVDPNFGIYCDRVRADGQPTRDRLIRPGFASIARGSSSSTWICRYSANNVSSAGTTSSCLANARPCKTIRRHTTVRCDGRLNPPCNASSGVGHLSRFR